MKIVVIGTRGIPNIQGGVETHSQELYPRLVNLGCEVTVIRRSCFVTPNNRIDNYKGVQLIDLYAPRNSNLETIVHSFLGIFQAKKIKADILHIHGIGPSLVVPFARLLGLKVVVTYHSPNYEHQKWGKLAKTFLKLGEKWSVKYANEVIAISNVINNIIKEKYNRNDAWLIYNGVSSATKLATTEYIEHLGLEKEKYILALGRFVPEKGFDLLIETFSQINDPEIKLVIAGDADHETVYSKKLKESAGKHNVILTGFITGDKLYELLSHAKLFVLPSFHEGLPIALLEAMSYGLNVLASDIHANKEIGLSLDSYFIAGDKDDLYSKLKRKIYSETVGSVEYDMSQYDWNKIALQTSNVYRNALTVKKT